MSEPGLTICRRFPPQTFLLRYEAQPGDAPMGAQMQTTAAFPAMAESGWCGEWRGRETATLTVLHPSQPVIGLDTK